MATAWRVARLPFIGIDGPSFKLTQVDVPAPQTYAVGGTMGTRVVDPTANPGTAFSGADASAKDAYDAVTPGDPAFAEFFLKDIVGDADQSNILRRLYSNANDLRAQQVDMKLQVLRFHYSQMLINGVGTTATARDFAGLTTLVTAAQTRAGTGVLHVDLDAAEFLVRSRQGRADYFVMDFLTFGLYLKGLRATGCRTKGTQAQGDRPHQCDGRGLWRLPCVPNWMSERRALWGRALLDLEFKNRAVGGGPKGTGPTR